MNTEKRILRTLILLLTVFFFSQFVFTGCQKDGPTKALVTVKDSLGRVVRGATVSLFQDTVQNQTTGVVANVRQTKTTDAAGNAEFEFALEALLNLKAEYNGRSATGFVRLELHKSVNQTITL